MAQEGGRNAGPRTRLWLVIVSLMVGYISASALAAQLTTPPCRFAKQYTTEEIVTNSTLRHQFIKDAFFWEGNFPKNGVGLNFATGLTYDGHGLNYSTGEPAPGMLHYWSAASKESLHLILLAHAVVGNELALTFACNDCANSSDQLAFVLTILQNKINSYNQWNARYPGFGGFIPWIYLNDSGAIPADGWENQVPGLDNGEMIWGIQAVYVALDKIGQTNLSNQYKAYFDLLAKNSLTVFYAGYGRVRGVAMIKDTQAAPTPSNYYTSSSCGRSCYLDDPYEGEMMTFFMDLYGDWGSEINQREDLWIYKRKMLRKVEYVLPPNFPKMVEEAHYNDQIPQVQKQALSKMLQQWKEAGSPSSISVQEGFWFSAHEQWKYLELPYLDVPVNQRVFFNGERARTWNSALLGIPGLFASVTDVSAKPNENPDYQSSMGIASIAFQPILVNTTITPYGSFPVWLTGSQGVGAAWYHSMLTGPSMQGPLGSTESGNLTGTAISPVVTWDSKISTLGAILGGIADFTRSALQRDGHYPRFKYIIEREWSRVFPTLNGELLPFALPVVPIPQTLGDFPTCTTTSSSSSASSGGGPSRA